MNQTLVQAEFQQKPPHAVKFPLLKGWAFPKVEINNFCELELPHTKGRDGAHIIFISLTLMPLLN